MLATIAIALPRFCVGVTELTGSNLKVTTHIIWSKTSECSTKVTRKIKQLEVKEVCVLSPIASDVNER